MFKGFLKKIFGYGGQGPWETTPGTLAIAPNQNPSPAAPSAPDKGIESSFISIAAHELRTPLTSIKGYLSVFLAQYRDSLNEDQKGLLSRIQTSADQLAALIENLLNVSRVERGTLVLILKPIDLYQLAQEVVEQLRTRAVNKNINLQLVPPAQPLTPVRADKIRLVEVLSNLIGNAINYTPPGGAIAVGLEQTEEEVTVHVADNGPGIPKEALGNLFNKFYRINRPPGIGETQSGTGLGLYICKAIIELHKGKIWVDSEVGKGSVFSFSIPLK